jgi:putative hydrolase of the HAD superfamily
LVRNSKEQEVSPALSLDVVFVDLGKTLGEWAPPDQFKAYPSSRPFLAGLRGMNVRVGVITNLAPLDEGVVWEALVRCGLAEHIDRALFVSDSAAGSRKPDPAVFRFAAARAAVPPERAMFVGENLLELIGAAAAGMRTLWKPTSPGNELPG